MALPSDPLDALLFVGFAVSIVLGLVELAAIVARGGRYPVRQSAVSLFIALGQSVSSPLSTPWLANRLFSPIHAHRLTTLSITAWWHWLALFLVVELVYYWFHRWNHQVAWFWATHSVHHSSEYMNLTAAYRFGWTGLLSAYFLVWAPLVWLGLPPRTLFGVLTASMIYQGWLHTETVGRLPRAVEWLFNTPSRHRLHHAVDPRYRDRNFGGVLMVFDHLFGTAAVEEEGTAPSLRYGLAGRRESSNPLRVVFGGWLALAAEVRRARTFGEALRRCWRMPAR